MTIYEKIKNMSAEELAVFLMRYEYRCISKKYICEESFCYNCKENLECYVNYLTEERDRYKIIDIPKMSNRVKKILKRMGFIYLDELSDHEPGEFLRYRNLGIQAYKEIVAVMIYYRIQGRLLFQERNRAGSVYVECARKALELNTNMNMNFKED